MRRAALLVLCIGCRGACSAPKPIAESPEDKSDAAPSSGEVPSRCEQEWSTSLGEMEVGRAAMRGNIAFIGGRRGARTVVATLDTSLPKPTATITELADAAGDAPAPLPIVVAERTLTVGYERAAPHGLHLVIRDLANPAALLAELPVEPADASLAFDAVVSGHDVVIAWDAPAEDGSAIYTSTLHADAASTPVRASIVGSDADTPRLVSNDRGTTLVWLAHRAMKVVDGAAPQDVPSEGPGQDLEHAWVEMQPLGAAATRLTPESGSVTGFDVTPQPNGFDLVARDGIELGAGQGAHVLAVNVRNGAASPSTQVAEHAGRGAPALVPPNLIFFPDPAERGRAVLIDGEGHAKGLVSPEIALDASRPLAPLPAHDTGTLRFLVATALAHGVELRAVHCATGSTAGLR